ncbi:MAG: hypothetical protein OEY59_03255 [Deltaproteobacteria bacterium]|nr:hypothetical protein [Deltaproteobacteria bacterium]
MGYILRFLLKFIAGLAGGIALIGSFFLFLSMLDKGKEEDLTDEEKEEFEEDDLEDQASS